MDSGALVTLPWVAGPFRLEPFRALTLAPSRVGDVASARAFAKPYKTVAARLSRWESRGQLQRDATPALYLHEYTAGGITVRGLVGALDVSRRTEHRDDVVVFPHEGIHPEQADNLAERMAEMQLNPAPILLVHRAPTQARDILAAVRAHPPDVVFTDRAEQRHRVWAVRDPDALAALGEALRSTRALIADGHHRYAAYLRLQQRLSGSADLGLAMLVDHDDTPLFLGPIHRVLEDVDLDALRAAARSIGARFLPAPAGAAIAALGPSTVVATDGQRWAAVQLDVPRDEAAVEVLHRALLPALPTSPSKVTHHHSVDDALRRARHGCLALLLPAPDVDLVLRIVASGRLLPEKATSFQPKPNLGVLIRSLRDE